MTPLPTHSYQCGILTLSDKGAAGLRKDESGQSLQNILTKEGFLVTAYQIIADEESLIKEVLIDWSDRLKLDLVVTTGGTGVSPRDRTPEATMAVLDIEIPGISEAMRMESFKITPRAMLSRGRSGVRGQTLITNLPGSTKAAEENIAIILPCLVHAIYKIKGGGDDCGGE
ncbi:MAG: MogA/MoaB family molybdenum cofactor biosynthesis protein [Proteobacteria bacterium]|nr:MogA/MoaB family molybdenum cofactor biosynthesis protein [Desulfobulbaceae bacterium]MBU4151368.1 MogA/MoaB family molybdenum cofactor biosynthesis protein [Pseudomonadota bacterium]